MTSPDKPYYQSHFTEVPIPQPNVYETDDGDIIPDPEAAEGYLTSTSDDQRRKRDAADHEAVVEALISEAEGAAARQEIRDWGTNKLREDYDKLYAEFEQARAGNDGAETARLWLLVNKKAEEIQAHRALIEGKSDTDKE